MLIRAPFATPPQLPFRFCVLEKYVPLLIVSMLGPHKMVLTAAEAAGAITIPAALAAGIVIAPAASAAVSTILCGPSIETINNGTYFSSTQNLNGNCGGVANGARINIYGSYTTVSRDAFKYAKGTYTRSY